MSMTFAFPVIRPEDYEAFRKVVGSDLADTYDGWTKHISKRVNEAQRSGATIVEVEVDLDEFVKFCSATGRACDLYSLLALASEKSFGQK